MAGNGLKEGGGRGEEYVQPRFVVGTVQQGHLGERLRSWQ